MMDNEQGPPRIWLAPKCYEKDLYGRFWHDYDEGPCEDCGLPSVEYVRADLVASLHTVPPKSEQQP